MPDASQLIFQIAVVIFSIIIHEVSHGYVALALGDETAQRAGRLTLNPFPHIDLVGSILVPILSGGSFGWAKPVPYDPYNLRSHRWGPALVGVAGPLANIFLAVIFGLLVRFSPLLLGILPGIFVFNFLAAAKATTFINLALAVFNLIPIPPLDGSKLLFSIMPYRWHSTQEFLGQYGFFIVIILVFILGNWFMPILFWPISFFFYLITGLPTP